jgi:hypothetical protein
VAALLLIYKTTRTAALAGIIKEKNWFFDGLLSYLPTPPSSYHT